MIQTFGHIREKWFQTRSQFFDTFETAKDPEVDLNTVGSFASSGFEP